MWLFLVIIGLVFVVGAPISYRYRDSPNVHFKGGSPKKVATWSVITGSVLTILGVLGYFFPRVMVWMKLYSETSESISSAWGVLLFLGLQGLLVFGFLYSVVYKRIIRRKASDAVPAVLFFGVLSAIYWIWIIWSGSFDKAFKAPLQHLYKLVVR